MIELLETKKVETFECSKLLVDDREILRPIKCAHHVGDDNPVGNPDLNYN